MKRTREAQQRRVDDPLLTLREAADQFGRSESTISRWVQAGLIEVEYLPSGRPSIRRSVVESWLETVAVE
jgi:predicted site-specific integrase-resolvase